MTLPNKTRKNVATEVVSRLLLKPARSFLGSLVQKSCKAIVIARIRKIKSRDFSIIASNCTGTLPYRFLNMPYTSPTINLYFMAPDYLRFVKRLDYYLSLPLSFTEQSRYLQAEQVRKKSGGYPVGVLDDIEIHFMHYNNEIEAAEKWHRRKQRINRDKLILAFTDKDLCTPELLREFDTLPYKNKFVFTANPHPEILNSIQVKHYAGQREMGDAYTNYNTLLRINFARLIDGMIDGMIDGVIDAPIRKRQHTVANDNAAGAPLKSDNTSATSTV